MSLRIGHQEPATFKSDGNPAAMRTYYLADFASQRDVDIPGDCLTTTTDQKKTSRSGIRAARSIVARRMGHKKHSHHKPNARQVFGYEADDKTRSLHKRF